MKSKKSRLRLKRISAYLSIWVLVVAMFFIQIEPVLAQSNQMRYITDEQGRALILHGLNTASSSKDAVDGMPWVKQKDVEREAKVLGFNFVRFLIFWSHIEPKPGVYNEQYLDRVAERVKWYQDQGMFVLLDMHQDLYGPATSGNGAPAWATYTDGLPVEYQTPWALTYLQPGVIRAFDHFWNVTNKHPELEDHYVKAWKHVANRFKDHPAVIGYDLMNEPYGGRVIWPFFEPLELKPMYERVINGIRQIDKKRWIFFEPQAFGPNQGLPSTLPSLQDPREGESRLVYAPHLYPLSLEIGGGYTGVTKELVRFAVNNWKNSRQDEIAKYRTPFVVGEFGLNITSPGAMDYVDDVLAMIDQSGGSWAYWSSDPGSWGPYDEDGDLNELASHLSRPYPRAIAGEPINWHYDTTKRVLSVKWKKKAQVTGSTDIFIPLEDYPQGWELVENDTGKHSSIDWDEHTRILKITPDPKQSEYMIQIKPK
ncbi:endoglycosylceramidase [Thermoactinomyces sp. DSM 45891]|uniref:cellulase family glycosylhydrolase n=1 Tax=Thermoactinomyces sp. DSM 45891 TaxID=1761907 RepID=UPI00091C93EF|nr:cellulase family glycosylhydrolase [Thermoactinomyces sp. DSM 45891]SFX60329.1 endoglycosylceramidase [Thermoactinomyces sp. DSM 45891]